MSFLHPGLAAAGLACIAIPIIIHLLLRRRRKPVRWAAMRFLLEAYRQHRRRLRLEQILLLAARCLLVALVAVALGRPLFGAGSLIGGRAPVTLYVVVDNGLAASAMGDDGRSALARHKAAADGLLSRLDTAAGDRAGLIALGAPAQALVVPASGDAAAVRDLVQGLTATDSATDLQGAIAILNSELSRTPTPATGESRVVVAVLSDFLNGSADLDRDLGSVGRRAGVTLLASPPAERGVANVSVIGAEPLRPLMLAGTELGESPVRVTLRRSGPDVGQAGVTAVRLGAEPPAGAAPAAPLGQAAVRWSPGQTEATVSATAKLPADRPAGQLVLTAAIDPDAIAGDNLWRRIIEVRPALRVGIVRSHGGPRPGVQQFEPADWYRVALEPGDASGPQEIETVDLDTGSLDAPRLAGLDALILPRPDELADGGPALWTRLRAFLDAGGLMIVSPPAPVTVHLWPDVLTRELGLDWSIGREAVAFADGAAISPERPGSDGAHDLLSLLGPELPDLVRPVHVLKALPIELPPGAAGARNTRLLSLANGAPLAVASPPGADAVPRRGLVVFIAAAPSFEWTDLQAKPLMVPLMQELVRQGVGRARGTWAATAGERPELPARTAELRSAAGTVIAAGTDGRLAEPVRWAGAWRAQDAQGSGRGTVVVNPDVSAARTDPQAPIAVQTWLAGAGAPVQWLTGDIGGGGGAADLGSTLGSDDDPAVLSAWLLGAALAVALAELGLARLFSHSGVTGATP